MAQWENMKSSTCMDGSKGGAGGPDFPLDNHKLLYVDKDPLEKQLVCA